MSKIAILKQDAPAVSPARQALAAARTARAQAQQVFESAVRAQQRAERLIAAPAALRARVAELEASAASVIENWARTGSAAPPPLPTSDECAALRLELVEVERLADAARAAMPALSANVAAAQSGAQAAIDTMRGAVGAILIETAEAIAAKLAETDRRAALLRADMRALQHHLQIDMARGNRAVAGLQDQVRRMVPARIEATDTEAERRAKNWTTFANRLLEDDKATLEEI